MRRAKKGTKENPITTDDLAAIADAVLGEKKRPYRILEATIKDDFCNYSYEMTEGKGPYDLHTVKGKGIIMDDMREVFRKFRVHMAAIYGVFKLQGIEIKDIDLHHSDDIVLEFHVTGFKIKGSDEMESIVLIGSKHCPETAGRIDLALPPIDISTLSSYKWYNELKELADRARDEVSLYKEGKYIVPDTEEDDDGELKPKGRRARQLTIASADVVVGIHETDDDVDDIDEVFKGAQV